VTEENHITLRNMSHWHSVHCKFHIHRPGLEPEPPRWQVSD